MIQFRNLTCAIVVGLGAAGAAAQTCNLGFCTDDPLVAADGETAWRYVGLQLDGAEDCPVAEGWVDQKVFDFGAAPVPAALKPYCLYEWLASEQRGGGPDPASIIALVDQDGPLVQADPDVMVVSYMGSGLKELIADPLRDFFLSQAGQAPVLPVGGTPNVRLALLDTQPDSDTPVTDPVAISRHGHGLVHAINELACDANPNCNVRLTTSLALPFRCAGDATCFDATGGFMGTPVDVGRAIARELARWNQSPPAGGEARLVINLSLGWDPLFNDCSGGCGAGAPGPLPGRISAQAVHAALQVASCRGAIVIAAAGNAIAGPVPSNGPLLPGAFEMLPAPTLAECEDLLAGAAQPDDNDFPPSSRPLVHSVAAVRAGGDPIVSRNNGEPELVAFGDHVVAYTANNVATATQTGTSVAAAVVSASVAAAWTFRPDVPGWRIMDDTRNAGIPVLRSADYCLNAPCPEVVRITACRVLEKVCSASEGTCPPPNSFQCDDPLDREPVLPLDVIQAQFGALSLDVTTLTNTVISQCVGPGTTFRAFHDAVPADWCPDRQYFSAQATPWAGGQPGSNNCQDCLSGFASPGTLYIEVDASFQTEHPTIVCTPSPGTIHAYSLENFGDLIDGDRFVVTGLPQSCIDTGIALSGRIVDPNEAVSVRAPLLISTDPDSDGVPAAVDNCSTVANDDQRDTDADGIGSLCDPDLNNDCSVNFLDLQQLKSVFFSADADADFNGDGTVNFGDLMIFVDFFPGAPGPTGPVTPCDPGIEAAGSFDVNAGFSFDLDAGGELAGQLPPADIWFQRTLDASFLIPQNGALHAVFGNLAPERTDCAATVVSSTAITLGAPLDTDVWACAQTNTGQLSRYRITGANAFPLDEATRLTIEFATWE